jgi:uroporphyrinogen decarboxylase
MVGIVGRAIPPQRKRVLDAINLREPDRVPIGMWGTLEGYQHLRQGLGMHYNKDPSGYRTGSTTWTTDTAFEIDIAEKLDGAPGRVTWLSPDKIRGSALRYGDFAARDPDQRR